MVSCCVVVVYVNCMCRVQFEYCCVVVLCVECMCVVAMADSMNIVRLCCTLSVRACTWDAQIARIQWSNTVTE